MPRKARIVIEGMPHHITQRGNNRQDVFFVDDDRRSYLSILKEQSEKYGLEVIGWCLMTNHVHLIATPGDSNSLAKAVGRTNFIYTQTINHLHGRSGHLWQNRFFSCPLDRGHFWQALQYVEQNPLRAKMARKADDYKWSSARAHIDMIDKYELLDIAHWKKISALIDWPKKLKSRLTGEQLDSIRLNTHTGRPLASDSFLSKLEKKLNRRLRPLPVGRPKKE